jgi:hypothetical protein
MEYYNLYYLGNKLNNRPVDKEQLNNIMNEKNISKRNPLTGKLDHILTKQISIVKTIII